MKKLAQIVEKMHNRVRPLFERGGPLHVFFPIFEAADTFALTPDDVTPGPPHVRDALDMKRTMMFVVIALAPCTLFGIFNAGYLYNTVNQVEGATWITHILRGLRIVLPIIIVSYAVGGFWEVLFALVRKHEINEGFLVTGLLFPLTLPPTIPLWQVAVGISFGVVIGKEIFGGTGFNVLNPALTSRAFLYFAYPAQMSGDNVWAVTDPSTFPQGFTGATSLAVAKAAPAGSDVIAVLRDAGFTFKDMIMGLEPGSIGETSAIAVAIGLVILVVTGIGSWRIIAGGIIGTAATTLLINALPASVRSVAPHLDLPFHYDLVMGGMFFGIVFMATDPVSAAATTPGKWAYGILIGFLTVTIRAFNPAFPAGNMLAILFANVMAPLIDQIVLALHIRQRAAWKGALHRA
ncbi:MAG: Na(+)-translocating NADH-quinone reductase subunit B [Verrucomicrobia bacterium ADurb.Bin345]|nr:MAG: Na(+)-translocating NADH-quinone reductase subunit B [Verrucomicrobia bacterium ADurb.Bin345]